MSIALAVAPEAHDRANTVTVRRDRLEIHRAHAWTEAALCKGKTELFFGSPRERPERRARREDLARKYCLVCPSLEPCRDVARNNRENGFWGGESEEERAAAGYPPSSISRRGVLRAAREAVPPR